MIDVNKKYKTRDGREVTDLHILPEPLRSASEYPVHALIEGKAFTFNLSGFEGTWGEKPHDLIEVKEPRKMSVILGKTCHGNIFVADYLETEIAKKHYDNDKTVKIIEITEPEFD